MSRRETQGGDWEEPVPLGAEINSAAEDGAPTISPSGLELYYYSKRSDGHGGCDIWVSRRPTVTSPWGLAENIGPPVNSGAHELSVTMTADELEMVFARTYSGASGADLFITKRVTKGGSWGTPVKLSSAINTSASEAYPSISADGLVLLFSSHAAGALPSGGQGGPDIWLTRRQTREDVWESPANPGPPLNSQYAENCPNIFADGSRIYFCDWGPVRPGGYGSDDLWEAPIIRIVDFDGDGKVDQAEILVMADRWGTDDSLCDIGPMAWGDGVVDVQDLRVLAEYIGEPVDDPTLVAHWALDEAEGDVAHDSGYANDATILGAAIWHPEGGAVGGGLEFNGVDTCLETPEVLNPADGSFSILAWVQGGAPGQVIVSQAGGQNWLMADASDGALMTALAPAVSRQPAPLVADVLITDGNWHRIAFVRDGATRALYVDGMLVAEDTQLTLAPCTGGLYIGCDKDQTPGTFWTGLIDDIRIYNRAVRP